MADRQIDAFILYNEKETVVGNIVERLSALRESYELKTP